METGLTTADVIRIIRQMQQEYGDRGPRDAVNVLSILVERIETARYTKKVNGEG